MGISHTQVKVVVLGIDDIAVITTYLKGQIAEFEGEIRREEKEDRPDGTVCRVLRTQIAYIRSFMDQVEAAPQMKAHEAEDFMAHWPEQQVGP